jgi:hypothetical protein
MKYCFEVPSPSFTTSFPVDENELPPPTVFETTLVPCGRTIHTIRKLYDYVEPANMAGSMFGDILAMICKGRSLRTLFM